MVKLRGVLALFLALAVHLVYAQERTISGTVSDAEGPLPGVNVLLKNTTTGVETDFDGNFTIIANTGDVIVFSYVGYKTVEKTIGDSNTINILLEEDSNVLEEVIVVGYGTSTKQAYTGTAKTVKSEQLETKSFANVTQALAGEAAGVAVFNTSGQPGSSATIRIRGFGSINGNRDPLFVVDGVPFFGSFNSINPADIETTTILKDATATAIYGSRGANGVVLITTKSGKKGHSSIEVDIKSGINFNGLPRYEKIESPEQFIGLAWQALYNNGDIAGSSNPADYANARLFSGAGINPKYNIWGVSADQLIDPSSGQVSSGNTRLYNPENWEDYGFQTSVRTEANIKFVGGNDKTSYFSSFGYLNDEGYIINSNYRRLTSRLNLKHEPTKWLKANVNVGYTYGKTINNGQSEDSGSIFWFVDNIPSIYPLFERDANGDKIIDPHYGGYVYDYGIGRGFGSLTNSIADATYDLSREKRHSFNGNVSFTVKFSDNLSFQSRYGAQFYTLVDDNIGNPFYGASASQGGSLFKQNRELTTQNLLNMFTYENSFGDHNLKIIAAHESNKFKRQRTFFGVSGVVNLINGLDDPSNYVNSNGKPGGYVEEENLESIFGQINYNLNRKYFVSASIRTDGSSRFAKDKWGTFGSIGGSWIVSKEEFMDNLEFVNNFKVKASYGIVGDQAGAPRYSGRGGNDIDVDADGNISLPIRPIDNPDLTWESSKMFQTGLELGLFNGRIDATFDYYVKNTTDLFFENRIPISSGDAIFVVNDGKLRNSGFEFDINTKLIEKDNFKLTFGINGEFFNNKLTQMPIDLATGEEKILDQQGNYGRANGQSIFDFYMREWAGVDSADGRAMWFVNYDDVNNNNTLDAGEEIGNLTQYLSANPNATILETTTKTYQEATQRFTGHSAIPTVRGAFRLNAEIHNFSLSTLFGYSLGGHAYDGAYSSMMAHRQVGNNNFHTDILNAWKNPGDVTDIPRLHSDREINVNSTSTRFLTSTDYLSLSNVRLGYNFPKDVTDKLNLNTLNIWLSGDNLFLLSARDGFNPATSETGSSSTYRYSPLTTLSLGLKVRF